MVNWIDIIINIILIAIPFIFDGFSINYLIKKWDDDKWEIWKKILSIIITFITLISMIIYIVVRITRSGNTTLDLISNKNYAIFIPLLVAYASFLIFALKPQDEKEEKKIDIAAIIISSIIGIIIIAVLVYYLLKGGLNAYIQYALIGIIIVIAIVVILILLSFILSTIIILLLVGLMIGMIILIIIVLSFLTLTTAIPIVILIILAGISIGIYFIVKHTESKKQVKDEYNPLFNTKYPPPIARDITLDSLKNLKNALGNFKMDNDCDGKTCDSLYQQYIKSNGDNQILENLLTDLGMIDDKTSNESTPSLINQIIYIIYQIIQCKIGIEEEEIDIYKFGTWDWWRKNIYMWGKQLSGGKIEKDEGTVSTTTDPIQRYIYLISLLVCILFLFYNVGSYVINSKKIFGLGELDMGWLIYAFIATITAFGTSFGFFIDISKSQSTTQKIEVKNSGVKIKKSDYPESKLGRNGLIGYISAIIGFTVLSYFGGNTFGGKFGKVNAVALLIAIIIAFNTYYMILIPQLVIIGLILQKYILSTHIGDLLPTIVKGIVLIVILFASFYDTTYGDDTFEQDPDDPNRYKEKLKSEYNKPVWYIFGILVAFYIQNIVESLIGNTGKYDQNEWSLLFMPLGRYLLDVMTKGMVSYSAISVKNTFI